VADGCVITLPVPPEALARLKEAEARQRNETKKRGLPAEFVSVEGLLLLQRNNCGKCKQPLDFVVRWNVEKPPARYPVIAHKFLRKRGGGHTPSNVAIWHWGCNHQEAATEKRDTSKGDRMAVNWSAKDEPLIEARESRSPQKILSAGFRKPPGHVSALSKNSKNYRKRGFGK
jgi:5-methylcytosine-specific restriction endonuclease McrA